MSAVMQWPDHAQIANMLKTPQGIADVLRGGLPFSIQLSSLNPAAVNTASHEVVSEIDFNVSTLSDWETEEAIPIGYEDLVDVSQQQRVMTRVVMIKNMGSVPFRLVSFFEHPSIATPGSKSRPSFSLTGCVVDHFKGPMIPPGMITQLQLCCTVPGSFDGFLGNRYLCFCFENAKIIAPTAIGRLNFFSGMRVKGYVQKNEKPKDLSSEAKSFVPHNNMVLFDQPIGMIMSGHLTPISPPNYSKLLSVSREEHPIPPRMCSDYFEYARRNAVKDLLQSILRTKGHAVKLHGVVGDVRGKQTDACVFASQEPLAYLQRLMTMTHFEECQSIFDIVQYDLHSFSLEFINIIDDEREKEFPPLAPGKDPTKLKTIGKEQVMKQISSYQSNVPPPMYVRATFKVNGSNESRPKILVGDRIRLRPDDFHTNKLANFELEGRIIAYHLASESVTAEFSLEDYNYRSQIAPSLNGISSPRNWNKNSLNETILSLLKYHIRFTFERTGLAFVHAALWMVANREYLRESLFPGLDADVNSLLFEHLSNDECRDGMGGGELLDGVVVESNGSSGSNNNTSETHTATHQDHLKNQDRHSGLRLKFNQEQLRAIKTIATLPSSLSESEIKIRRRRLQRTLRQSGSDDSSNGYSSAIGMGDTRVKTSILGSHATMTTATTTARATTITTPAPLGKRNLPPFIIMGPPGTGKTSTVIAAIEEIRARRPELRILACAPSDAAADVIAIRLVHAGMQPVHLLRLNWYQRSTASVPVQLSSYCYTSKSDANGGGMYDIPGVIQLLDYQVIVCTCGTAGALGAVLAPLSTAHNKSNGNGTTNASNYGLGEIYFDVVLVDESSQATEAETLVPLSLCRPGGLMVLAGDPQQLGASSRSPVFSLGGFARSLQERLMGLSIYDGCRPSSMFFSFNQNNSTSASQSPSQMSAPASQNFSQMNRSRTDNDTAGDDVNLSLVSNGTITSNGSSSGSDGNSSSNGASGSTGFGVFLTKNYRSHKSIFEVSSRLLYGGRLEQCVDPSRLVIQGLESAIAAIKKQHNHRPNVLQNGTDNHIPSDLFTDNSSDNYHDKDNNNINNDDSTSSCFPVLFIGVDGQQAHELDSPSFYNLAEIDQMVITIQQLMTHAKVTTKDIGIIAAFRTQVLRIRQRLRSEGLGNINVGSVEDFQGQEVKIIVISTVQTMRIPSLEINGVLGLLGDHRRFNVSVTRGMALCIVIGEPQLLCTDTVWREFLLHCDKNHGYCGHPCPELYTTSSQQSSSSSSGVTLSGRNGGINKHDVLPLGGGHEQGNETITPTKITIQPSLSYKRQPFFNDSEWRVIL